VTAFQYKAKSLCCDDRPLAELARAFGTPLYVYSAHALRENYRRIAAAFAPLQARVCYAVKANFNLHLLRILKDEGAGFDIVSGGELYRVLKAGADPAHIVFAGVGKTEAELSAALEANIGWFNVESADELRRLNDLAASRGRRARIALRLNPDVEPDTHHHISTGGAQSKFGLLLEEARALARRIGDFPALELRGAHIHIGSLVAGVEPTLRALDVALDFIQACPMIDTLDFGGGFPIRYRETDAHPSIEDFAAPIVAKLKPHLGRLSFHLEPGRYIVANAGALVATVQAVKHTSGRRTLVVDTGMHHLLRPALYEAYHRLLPLTEAPADGLPCSVVGPICESADVLAHDRHLPLLRAGDLVALMDAGAYGFAMASHYNSQPLPAEVLVDGDEVKLIRRRETWEDLTRLEESS
jgi:diaminopimelate decarboxylase